jgi:large subunit ribosomal protein L4
MPAISIIDESGAVVGEHQLTDSVVEPEASIGLLHEVVRSELASYRQGTAAAKSRGQVSGSGAKPWRQKGTGRARAGSTRVPQWTKGGVAFPPIPRSYDLKVNKKARAKAFRMALGNLVEFGDVKVLSGVDFEQPSTQRAAAIVRNAELETPTLVVTAPEEIAATKSFCNLKRVRVFPINLVEVQDYIWARSAVFTEAAIVLLEGVALAEDGEEE